MRAPLVLLAMTEQYYIGRETWIVLRIIEARQSYAISMNTCSSEEMYLSHHSER